MGPSKNLCMIHEVSDVWAAAQCARCTGWVAFLFDSSYCLFKSPLPPPPPPARKEAFVEELVPREPFGLEPLLRPFESVWVITRPHLAMVQNQWDPILG